MKKTNLKINCTKSTILYDKLATNMRNNGFVNTYEVYRGSTLLSIIRVAGYCPANVRANLVTELRNKNIIGW